MVHHSMNYSVRRVWLVVWDEFREVGNHLRVGQSGQGQEGFELNLQGTRFGWEEGPLQPKHRSGKTQG